MKTVQLFSGLIFTLLSVSVAHAVDIKQEQINNCIAGTLRYKIADHNTAEQLCNCTVNVRSKMTIGQLWEIESFAQSGKDPSVLPYVIQLQKDLQNCTVGLTLNPPQKPSTSQ